MSYYISSATTVAYINTSNTEKTIFLPSTFNIQGKQIYVKDIASNAKVKNITLATLGGDLFENGTSNYLVNQNYGSVSFVAKNGKWFSLTGGAGSGGGSVIELSVGLSSLSSIVSYGLSSFIIPLSTLSTAISTRFTTSSFRANVISSTYGAFSTLSTANILVGYIDSPTQVSVGINTDHLIVSSITANYGIINENLGIGKEAPFWYALDVSGVARLPLISSTAIVASSITADFFIGDGGLLRNLPGSLNPGVSSLSSIVSYGLSSFIIPLSTFSTAISTRFTTGDLQTNTISSSYGEFSTLSTTNILIGYVDSPLQVDLGVTTGDIVASTLTVNYGLISGNLGIGKEAPYWYALDVSGAVRLPLISSTAIVASSITADFFVGDGGLLRNLPGTINPGVSSLSSIVSYGLSSLMTEIATAPGLSSLSSIVSYGLSSLGAQGSSGISSLSSIVSYGLSTLVTAPGLSSLSTMLSYGLSSVVLSTLTVSDKWPIKDYSVGAPGFSTMNYTTTGAPDTITNAIGKIDKWIYTSLLDQPSPPVVTYSNGGTTSALKYLLLFNSPFQFKVNFMDMWMPYISSLNVSVYDRVGGSNVYFFSMSNRTYLPNSPVGSNIQGIFFDTNLQYNTEKFGITCNYNGVTYSNLLYCPISNVSQKSYDIFVYYANFSINTVNTTSNPWIIPIGAQEPSPVNTLNVLFVNTNILNFSFTLSNVNCNNPAINTQSGSYVFANNEVSYSNLQNSSYPRRYNYSFVSNPIILTCNAPPLVDKGSNVSVFPPNLAYDTYYSFKVRTNNNVLDTYSLYSSNSGSNKTDIPVSAPRFTTIDSNIGSITTFPTQGVLASENYGTNYNVLQYASLSNAGGFKHNINANSVIAVHTTSNPGSAVATPIAFLQIVTSNTTRTSNTLYMNSWNGWEGSYSSNSNGATSYITTTIQDYYAGDTLRSNFYLVASNIGITINCNYLTASNVGYTYTITHSNLSNANISCNFGPFYVDNIVTPTVLGLSNFKSLTLGTDYNYVSGVLTLASSNNFHFNVDVSNYSKYFLPAINNFLTLTVGSNTSYVITTSNVGQYSNFYTLADAANTQVPYTNPMRFKLSNFSVNVGNYWTGEQLYANIITSNIAGSANVIVAVPYYYDIPSLCNQAQVSRIETNSNANTCNFKAYSNSFLIIGNASSNMYNYELPLVGGYYSSALVANTYYSNFGAFSDPRGGGGYTYPVAYSNLGADTRYAAFKYSLTNSSHGTSNVKLIYFTMSNPFGFSATGTNCNFTSAVSLLRYKIHNAGQYNTEWLNGNATKSSYLAFDSDTALNNSAGLRSNNCNTPISNVTRYFSMIPVPPGCNFDLYVKIGLNSASNIGFDFIGVSSITGITPPAPTEQTVSFPNIPTTCNNYGTLTTVIDWTNYDFPDKTPMISNIIILSNSPINDSRRAKKLARRIDAYNIFITINGNQQRVAVTDEIAYYDTMYDVGSPRFSNAFGNEQGLYTLPGATLTNNGAGTTIPCMVHFRDLPYFTSRLRTYSLVEASNILVYLNYYGLQNKIKVMAGFSVLTGNSYTGGLEWFDYSNVDLMNRNITYLSNMYSYFGTSCNIEFINIGNEIMFRDRPEYKSLTFKTNSNSILTKPFLTGMFDTVTKVKDVMDYYNRQNNNKYPIAKVGWTDATTVPLTGPYKNSLSNSASNEYRDLINSVDFYGTNIYSDNEVQSTDANVAAAAQLVGTKRVYYSAKNNFNKDVIITEHDSAPIGFNAAGWPLTKEITRSYYPNLLDWLRDSNIPYYQFWPIDGYNITGGLVGIRGGFYNIYFSNCITDNIIASTRGSITQYSNTKLLNLDMQYNTTIYNINDSGIGSILSSNFRTPLPIPTQPFYHPDNVLRLNNIYKCNYNFCNAYSITSRIFASNILNLSNIFTVSEFELFKQPITNNVSKTENPFYFSVELYDKNNFGISNLTVNVSNSSTGRNFCGDSLSNFIFYANITKTNTQYNNVSYRFNPEMYSYQFFWDIFRKNPTYSNNGDFFICFTNFNYYQYQTAFIPDITNSGFFLTVDCSLRIYNTDVIIASSYPYTFTLSNNYRCNIVSPPYYFDDFHSTRSPSVVSVLGDIPTMSNRAYYDYVCGVASYKTNNCNFNFWICASNLGNKFFRDKPVKVALYDNVRNVLQSNFTFYNQATIFYSTSNKETILTDSVSGTNNRTFFYWSNVEVSGISNHYSPDSNQTITFYTTSCNININQTTTIYRKLTNMYIDTISLQTIAYSSTSNFGSNNKAVGCNWGARVTSGYGSYPTFATTSNVGITFGGIYNNSISLVSYSNELQLVGGLYTGSNTTRLAYQNYGGLYDDIPGAIVYPDYSALDNSTQRRYATFRWFIDSTDIIGSTALLGQLYFNGHNIPSGIPVGSPNFYAFNNTVTFQYKIIGSNGGNISGWLNGNSYMTTAGRNSNWFIGNNCNGGALQANTPKSTANVRYIWLYSQDPSTTQGKPPFTLYARIGYPANCNFQFSNIVLCNVNISS
jgi:hypothetical protein